LVDSALQDLPAASAPVTVPEVKIASAGALHIERMAVPQSVVTFGMSGLKRDDPDFYAAYVMNEILGGSNFTSRLFTEVREKRGLAYSVYSYLAPLRSAGLYVGGVATQNARVGESLALIKVEIARMANEGVSAAELEAIKRQLTGAFALRFDTGPKIADMLIGMQIDNLGIDYLERRNGYINAVTVEDVARVAHRLLNPDQLVVVIAGDPQGLDVTPGAPSAPAALKP
jgi:zinc protease